MGDYTLADTLLGLFAIFVSLSFHEFGHAYIAYRLYRGTTLSSISNGPHLDNLATATAQKVGPIAIGYKDSPATGTYTYSVEARHFNASAGTAFSINRYLELVEVRS